MTWTMRATAMEKCHCWNKAGEPSAARSSQPPRVRSLLTREHLRLDRTQTGMGIKSEPMPFLPPTLRLIQCWGEKVSLHDIKPSPTPSAALSQPVPRPLHTLSFFSPASKAWRRILSTGVIDPASPRSRSFIGTERYPVEIKLREHSTGWGGQPIRSGCAPQISIASCYGSFAPWPESPVGAAVLASVVFALNDNTPIVRPRNERPCFSAPILTRLALATASL